MCSGPPQLHTSMGMHVGTGTRCRDAGHTCGATTCEHSGGITDGCLPRQHPRWRSLCPRTGGDLCLSSCSSFPVSVIGLLAQTFHVTVPCPLARVVSTSWRNQLLRLVPEVRDGGQFPHDRVRPCPAARRGHHSVRCPGGPDRKSSRAAGAAALPAHRHGAGASRVRGAVQRSGACSWPGAGRVGAHPGRGWALGQVARDQASPGPGRAPGHGWLGNLHRGHGSVLPLCLLHRLDGCRPAGCRDRPHRFGRRLLDPAWGVASLPSEVDPGGRVGTQRCPDGARRRRIVGHGNRRPSPRRSLGAHRLDRRPTGGGCSRGSARRMARGACHSSRETSLVKPVRGGGDVLGVARLWAGGVGPRIGVRSRLRRCRRHRQLRSALPTCHRVVRRRCGMDLPDRPVRHAGAAGQPGPADLGAGAAGSGHRSVPHPRGTSAGGVREHGLVPYSVAAPGVPVVGRSSWCGSDHPGDDSHLGRPRRCRPHLRRSAGARRRVRPGPGADPADGGGTARTGRRLGRQGRRHRGGATGGCRRRTHPGQRADRVAAVRGHGW